MATRLADRRQGHGEGRSVDNEAGPRRSMCIYALEDIRTDYILIDRDVPVRLGLSRFHDGGNHEPT